RRRRALSVGGIPTVLDDSGCPPDRREPRRSGGGAGDRRGCISAGSSTRVEAGRVEQARLAGASFRRKAVDQPQYSVVILTWNSRQYVMAFLQSLKEAAPRHRGEVIVIDNGSRDSTPELVRQYAPEAHLVRNASNRGVAAARNQGLVLARAPVAI